VIILDANILVYAHNADAPEHARARRWLEELFARPEQVGLPWPTLWAYLRILTNRRLPSAVPAPLAFQAIRNMLARPRATTVEPGPRHAAILEEMVVEGQAAGPLITDAVLAALAIEHGATLASTDRDFARFTGLRWINPLK
jgi:toxin-antitoxin system PIN domain toxin